MAAVEFNAEMTAGDKVVLRFTVRDKASAIVDLTGASFTANLSAGFGTRSSPAPIGSKLLTPDKTLGVGIDVPTPASGVVEVTIETSDTATFEGTYFFLLRMTNALGDPASIAKGSIEINRSIL